MNNNNLNIFEFFYLIYKFKIKILISVFIFTFIGFAGFFLQKEKFVIKTIVHPLSLIEFESFYISENKINEIDKDNHDAISLRQITPLTLFFSYLNEIKSIKIENKLNHIDITWNFLGGQHELYLTSVSYKDKKSSLSELNNFLRDANKNIVLKLKENLSNEIKIMDTLLTEKREGYEYFLIKRKTIIQNLKNLDNQKIVNYDIEGTMIKSNKISLKLFIIIFTIIGFTLGIIQILFSEYFKNKNKVK
jgi:LPS O-antigen subunit length determinant protein (WzzB/FepE family)